MPELETKIAAWRARMSAALPHRNEAVVELEEHLREHLAALQRQGKSEDEAFALAQERLGSVQVVAHEFDRMPAGWRPGVILLWMLALLLALAVGASLWGWSRRLPLTIFQIVASCVNGTGFFGILGSGVVAASALITSCWRPLRERERQAVRQLLKMLTRLAGVFLPVGLALVTVWRAQFVPNFWTLGAYELRLIAILASLGLLAFTQSRRSRERVLWLTAICASLVAFFSGFAPRFRVADVPIAWLGAVFLAGQIFLAVPRFRIVRVRDPNCG